MHVIGTAGHVDHGKSTLVEALTGIDPDRLAEEKAREMTIDLGFAWLTLDGEEIGIVDVPGHRDFIENMLAGVGSIDLALLVIAADEGVMPQTREHLAILDLLEINRGIVALTKSDLVDDPDWLELVTLEISDVLQGTTLADAPIIPVSARSGAGLNDLKSEISIALRAIGPRPDWAKPRLPIDRIFSLPGFGTVVTGTLVGGSLHVGNEVQVEPGKLIGRVRGLQTHKVKRETVHPGSRVAINLTGIDREVLYRGQVVTLRGQIRETRQIDVTYRHLRDVDVPLRHNDAVKLFTGAAEVSARARVIGREHISPGESGWVQLTLDEPVAVTRGDRFILRRPSPGMTLGGGLILDPHAGRRHRRFRADVIERFSALSEGTSEDLLLNTLERLGPVQASTLVEKAGLTASDALEPMRALVADGRVIDLGRIVIAAPAWHSLGEKILAELESYHRNVPLRGGLEREALRSKLQCPPLVFNALLDRMSAEGQILESSTLLQLPHHRIEFTPEQERSIAQLMSRFESQGILSPSVKECKAMVGDLVYYALVDLGRLKPVSEDVVYSADIYERLIARLTRQLHQQGSISAGEARDLLDCSRKYAIALLEHMDELHITQRSGDSRIPTRPLKE
ncbi:MAG: selenocysteine-specific translation elongation factor [Chloroflexota bacterium]